MNTPAEKLARLALLAIAARKEADANRTDLDRKRHADRLTKQLEGEANTILHPPQKQPPLFGGEK